MKTHVCYWKRAPASCYIGNLLRCERSTNKIPHNQKCTNAHHRQRNAEDIARIGVIINKTQKDIRRKTNNKEKWRAKQEYPNNKNR